MLEINDIVVNSHTANTFLTKHGRHLLTFRRKLESSFDTYYLPSNIPTSLGAGWTGNTKCCNVENDSPHNKWNPIDPVPKKDSFVGSSHRKKTMSYVLAVTGSKTVKQIVYRDLLRHGMYNSGTIEISVAVLNTGGGKLGSASASGGSKKCPTHSECPASTAGSHREFETSLAVDFGTAAITLPVTVRITRSARDGLGWGGNYGPQFSMTMARIEVHGMGCVATQVLNSNKAVINSITGTYINICLQLQSTHLDLTFFNSLCSFLFTFSLLRCNG